MSGFFSAPRRFVTENTGPDAKGYWYAPRRYDAHLDRLPEVAILRGLTKGEQLNYTIKRLFILTLREVTLLTLPDYSVENCVLSVDLGDAVSSTILQINGIRVRVIGNKLKLP